MGYYQSTDIKITFKDGNQEIELEAESIQTFELTEKFNDHARLKFTRIAMENNRVAYRKMLLSLPQVKVECKGKCLFQGMITHIELSYDRDPKQQHYIIGVEGISYTYKLDAAPVNRSFPNKDMDYRSLVNSIVASPNYCLYNGPEQTQLNHFILQYQETDWGFLKRLASNFHSGLFADPAAGKAQFSFGTPTGEHRKDKLQNLEIAKKIGDYRVAFKNGNRDVCELDFTEYQWKSGEWMNLGDVLHDEGLELRVKEITARVRGSELVFIYTLIPSHGLCQNPFYNPRLTGVSLEGTVTKLDKDQAEAHLTIDNLDTNKACRFSYGAFYTAVGNTGWYCMPEVNDPVRIYFPTVKEEDAIVLTSCRKKEATTEESKRMGDPANKYFRTQGAKEVNFAGSAVYLSADEEKNKEVYLKLDRFKGDGAQIDIQRNNATSDGTVDIKIEGAKDLTIKSAKSQLILAAKTISLGNGNTDILTLDKQNGMQVSANAKLNCQLVQAKSKKEEQAASDNSKEDFWATRQDWIHPLEGKPTNPPTTGGRNFGALRPHRRNHAGIDFTAEPGRKVLAMTDGVVFEVKRNFYAGTDYVAIKHSDGTIGRYCEIRVLVQNGIVTRGQIIGQVIANIETGYSMLHLELYKGIASGPLTQLYNKKYLYVPARNYQRRMDLMDPTGAKDLKNTK